MVWDMVMWADTTPMSIKSKHYLLIMTIFQDYYKDNYAVMDIHF